MSVTLDRFVRVLSAGKVSDALVTVRTSKVDAALNLVAAEYARLTHEGLRGGPLETMLRRLRDAREAALAKPNNQAQCEELGRVKEAARAAAAKAKPIADKTLADFARFRSMLAAVQSRTNAAAVAVDAITDSRIKEKLGAELADIQNRRVTLVQIDDAAQLADAMARANLYFGMAKSLADRATQLMQLEDERIEKLSQIDQALAPLAASLAKVTDPALLARAQILRNALDARRVALRDQVDPKKLEEALTRVPTLLADIARTGETFKNYAEWCRPPNKGMREMVIATCEVYRQQGQTQNLRWLTEAANKVMGRLAEIVQHCPDDPRAAVSDLQDLFDDFKELKDRYNQEVLRPPLLERVAPLLQNPDSPESQMCSALGESRFMQRLLDVHQTAAVLGANTDVLSPGEMVAIYSYTWFDFTEMNGRLLNFPTQESEESLQKIDIKNKQCEAAVRKLPPAPGPTTRGERDWIGADAQYQVGKEFTIASFWSTGNAFAGRWQITVIGQTGRSLEKISAYPWEGEVLYLPGTRFRVISRDDSDPNAVRVRVQEVR